MEQTINQKLINKNVLLIFGITLFAVMGVASISPALPKIQDAFELEKGQIKWLISVFTIPGFILTPFMGVLADKYGRKIILVPSLILFAIGALLCVFSSSYEQLLVFRLIQGIGGASLSSINVTLIGDFFKGQNRVKVMGYNASVLSIGTASYPAIGGFLASINWNAVFMLPLVAVPLAFLVLIYMDKTELKPMNSLAAYFINLWKAISKVKVVGLFLINVLVFIILYGCYLTFFPIFLKDTFNADSILIGITMSLMSVITAISASQLGRVNLLLSAKNLLLLSSVSYLVSMVLLANTVSWSFVIPAVIIFGMGHGLFVPNVQTLLVGMSTTNERAAFMSINGMVLRLGQFLGPIVIAAFYLNESISLVFYAGAGVALLMMLVITVFIKKEE
ncbi:MAG: MFS transporter [Bacteroidales bacterium]|nr:MFS transporter [Bacteroidales bacterium]MBN2820185.1 MFS transporter [Bacteroidales bacterium]